MDGRDYILQRWNSYLSCYSSLLSENSQYIAMADIERTVDSVNSDNGIHQLKNLNIQVIYARDNPCLIFESSAIKFKPCLLVG